LVAADAGEKLGDARRGAGATPHNGSARMLNCKGFGSCGTCALVVRGAVEPAELTRMERWRLDFPPHDATRSRAAGMRLACQVRVVGDLDVEKRSGFWGEAPEGAR
ncbi:MAG: 2Fe-2S iron-sulfur cluster-binding protein, partial [Myxococcota bacterium]